MPKKASNKTASFMQFLHETYEQYKQKIKDGSHIPVKPHVFVKQDKTSHFGSIILHANNSCLNCTRASWKVKTFLSKDNKVGWTPLEFHKKGKSSLYLRYFEIAYGKWDAAVCVGDFGQR